MKFRSLRKLTGAFAAGGRSLTVSEGEIFDVPEYLIRNVLPLEANGLVERFRERGPGRKAYVLYENTALAAAPENKGRPIKAPLKAS